MITEKDLNALQRKLGLLTVKNPKMMKSLEEGYLSAILHLAPGDQSGHEVCPSRTAECTRLCLGNGFIASTDTVSAARIRRTKMLFEDRSEFLRLLKADISHLRLWTNHQGIKLTVRLNGTSDLPWFLPSFGNVYQYFNGVQFVEHTKVPGIAIKLQEIPNVKVVFSRSGENDKQVKAMLAKGISVAVVFGGKVMPETYLDYPVVPGDESDLRHLDPAGCVVGLKLKASYSTNAEGKKRVNVPSGHFVVLESRAQP